MSFPSSRVKSLLLDGAEFPEQGLRISKDAVDVANKAAVMFLKFFAIQAKHARVLSNAKGASVQFQDLEAAANNRPRLEFLKGVLEDLRQELAITQKEEEALNRKKSRSVKKAVDGILEDLNEQTEEEVEAEPSEPEVESTTESESEASEAEEAPRVVRVKDPNALFDSEEEREEEERQKREQQKERKRREKELKKQMEKMAKAKAKAGAPPTGKRAKVDAAVSSTPALTLFFKPQAKSKD